MSAFSKFNPLTDHYVTGYSQRLPEVGSEVTLLMGGQNRRREQVIGAWWLEEVSDAHFHHRRPLAMITRTIE